MIKMRTWIPAVASAVVFGGSAGAQVPPSGSPAALASQTSNIHPANDKPTFSMRTAGQPDRAVRVLKMSDGGEGDSLAEVQDVQTGRVFTMPGKVVKAMLAGAKPPMPAAAPSAPPAALPAFQTTPLAVTPQPAQPSAVGAPVFQPNRVTTSIYERPTFVDVREVPAVVSVQTILPAPTPRAVGPQNEPAPSAGPKIPPPDVIPIARMAAKPEFSPITVEKFELITPPAAAENVVPVPTPAVAEKVDPIPTPAVAEKVDPVPTPAVWEKAVPVSIPVATPQPQPAAPAEPTFGIKLESTSASVQQAVPVETWQPMSHTGSPAAKNNSLWQPIADPAPVPPQPRNMNDEPKTTTVTTSCRFETPTGSSEQAPTAQLAPHAKVERGVACTSALAQLEAQVREDCQSTIYDLYTAVKPNAREDAATKLCASRFAQRPEVKAAILKAAIADPAPAVRAHCIECLMKLGHDETGYRLHLQGVADDGPKIVQAAAKAALAQLPPGQ